MKLLRLIARIGVLAALSSTMCRADSSFAGWQALSAMRAADYFAEPKQVALAEAIERGDQPQIIAAIKAGADVNFKGRAGIRPLFWCMAKQRVGAFRILLENGADPNVTAESMAEGERATSVMELAAIAGTPDYLRFALKHGGNANAPVGYANRTIIFEAMLSERNDNLGPLIEAGADVSRQDEAGETPLTMASSVSNYHAVYVLLKSSADPLLKNRWGADLAARMRRFGARGIKKESDQYGWYLKVVEEMKARRLLE